MFNVHINCIAWVEWAPARRGSSHDDIARFEGHDLGDVGNEEGRGEDHLPPVCDVASPRPQAASNVIPTEGQMGPSGGTCGQRM